MDNTLPTLAAQRLRLLQFYLPRLLTSGVPIGEERWLQALALQQLGAAVWAASDAEARTALVQARLDRLAQCLAAAMRLPKHRREVEPSGPVWQQVQSYLRATMPAVEARLRAQLSSEEAEPMP